MRELVNIFSEKRTCELILFAGCWTSILSMATCFSYMVLNVCMAVFVCLLVPSTILGIKAMGFGPFFRRGGFTLFYSISSLLWVASLIALSYGNGNDEVRGIVANVSVCVLVIGLTIIALFPNKRILPG